MMKRLKPTTIHRLLTLCFSIVILTSSGGILEASDPPVMRTLFEFTGDNPDASWTASNDVVMGGLSQGSAKITPEGMVFSGDLSLENNGGFSSIFARKALDLSEFRGLRIKVRGDGRTYQLRLESDAMFSDRWPVSFSSPFETTKGKWTEVFIPFSELNQTWRGRQLSGHTFNAKDVRRIGILLGDKRAGAFSLQVESIVAE